MIVTNHLLAGAIIGATASQPVLAVGLVFVSHFLLDALPHFGRQDDLRYFEALKRWPAPLVAIFTLVTSIALLVFLVRGSYWLMLLAGLAAAVPDLLGLYSYYIYGNFHYTAGGGGVIKKVFQAFNWLHRKVQWYEKPFGIVFELLVFTGLGLILLKLT